MEFYRELKYDETGPPPCLKTNINCSTMHKFGRFVHNVAIKCANKEKSANHTNWDQATLIAVRGTTMQDNTALVRRLHGPSKTIIVSNEKGKSSS